MKYILLLFTTFIFSQKVIINETDEFTKSKNITVAAFINDKLNIKDNISKSNDVSAFLYLSYMKDKDNLENQAIVLSFWFPKSTCLVLNDSKIMFLLENDKVTEMKHSIKTDCGTSLTFLSPITELKDFFESDIKKIRIYTSEKIYDIEIKEDKKEIIRKTFELYNSQINQ